MDEGQLIIKYVRSEGMVHNLKRENEELKIKLASLEQQLRLNPSSLKLEDENKISFEQYKNFIYTKDRHTYTNKETMIPMSLESVEERYIWHLENL